MNLLAYYMSIASELGGRGDTGSGDPGGVDGVFFRSRTSPSIQTPTVTPLPEDVVPGPGGQFRDVSSLGTFNTAVAAARAGDVIRQVNTIPEQLRIRGNLFGISGGNLTGTAATGGADGNPITFVQMPDTWIDPGNQGGNTVGLDIQNCRHVHAVGPRIRNAQFGLRLMNVEGSASNPVRVAHGHIQDIGHACYAAQGWFQLISSSGGVPTAGAGNEVGATKHVIFDYCHAQDPGRTATQFGEGFYAGKGAGPTGYDGWYGWCEDITYRGCTVVGQTADGFDIKPGCRDIKLLDPVVHAGAAHFGAPLGLLYVANTIEAKPSWMDSVDPEVYVEGARIYDLNLSKTQADTSNNMCYIGQSGVRMANSMFFAYPDGSSPFNPAIQLRQEHPGDADFGTFDSWIMNCLFWGRGVENAGHGTVANEGSVTAFSLGAWFTELNNITPVGYGGGQHTAAVDGSDFRGTIEAVGENGLAELGTFGAGSGFDLAPTSSLRAAGSTITPTFFFDQDISQRAIPASTPNPGPFQDGVTFVDLAFEQFDDLGLATAVLPIEWEVYDSDTGNNGWGKRRTPQAEVVAEGTATSGANVLRLTAENGTGGDSGFLVSTGVQLRVPFTYGQIECRVRVEADDDEVTSGVCIGWPADNEWPEGGEIDYYESFNDRDTRDPKEAYLHRLNPTATRPFTGSDDEVLPAVDLGIDGTAWHKMVMTKLPDKIYIEIDNGSPIIVTEDPDWITDNLIHGTWQLDQWPNPSTPSTQPTFSTETSVTMDIDYVLIREAVFN